MGQKVAGTSSLAHFDLSVGGEAASSYRSPPASRHFCSLSFKRGKEGKAVAGGRICGSSCSAMKLCQPLKKPNSAGAKPALHPPSSTSVSGDASHAPGPCHMLLETRKPGVGRPFLGLAWLSGAEQNRSSHNSTRLL